MGAGSIRGEDVTIVRKHGVAQVLADVSLTNEPPIHGGLGDVEILCHRRHSNLSEDAELAQLDTQQRGVRVSVGSDDF